MAKIHELRQRKADLAKQCRDLHEAHLDTEMSSEDQTRFDEMMAEIKKIDASILTEEQLLDVERSLEGVEIEDPAGRVADQPNKRPEDEKRFGSFGEMLVAVAHAGGKHISREEWDPRLHGLFKAGKGYQASASGANEAVPDEGGFAVQTDFQSAIYEDAHAMGEILSRVRRIPISAMSNALKLLAVDETSRADGSRWGGVQGYWANEADTVTATKPKYREIDLKLNKLMILGYTTEELLQDAVALEAVMRMAFAEEITFKTEDAIVNGDGAGKPLGWLNSGALITASASSGQSASVTTQNVLDMWTRMYLRGRRSALWYINQDVETQLFQLTLGSGTAVTLLYAPAGTAMNNGNNGRLMGRDVVPVEYCATLGTPGDIQLVDPMQMLMIDKNGVQQAASMHVRFLYDEMTFRVTYRLDAQPARRKALTPFKGSTTTSPFVALSQR